MTKLQPRKRTSRRQPGSGKGENVNTPEKEQTSLTTDLLSAPVPTSDQDDCFGDATNTEPGQLSLFESSPAALQSLQPEAWLDIRSVEDRKYLELEVMFTQLEDGATGGSEPDYDRLDATGLWTEVVDHEEEYRYQELHFLQSPSDWTDTGQSRHRFSSRILEEASNPGRRSRLQLYPRLPGSEGSCDNVNGNGQSHRARETPEDIMDICNTYEPTWRHQMLDLVLSRISVSQVNPRTLLCVISLALVLWMVHTLGFLEPGYRHGNPHDHTTCMAESTGTLEPTFDLTRQAHCNLDQRKTFKYRKADVGSSEQKHTGGESMITPEMWSELAQRFVTMEVLKTEVQQAIGSLLRRKQGAKAVEIACLSTSRCLYSIAKKRIVNLLSRLIREEARENGVQYLPMDGLCMDKDLVQSMVESALASHRASTLVSRDYALHSSGARIIQALTWTSYFASALTDENSTLLRKISWFMTRSQLAVKRQPPELAISPGTLPGECWAMRGTHGQIAVQLARRVVITGVSIDHADPKTVLDNGTAPKEIEIWSLDTPRQSMPSILRFYTQGHDKNGGTVEHLPYPGALLLRTVLFSVPYATGVDTQEEPQHDQGTTRSWSQGVTIQTFDIPVSMQGRISTAAVFRIKSNWGHPQFTCLYRVQVHGFEVPEEEDTTRTRQMQ